ncbi:MAG: hypothetical protein ACT4P2_00775 [Pseudomonadota bacterium]
MHGSFERVRLQAGLAAIEGMLAAHAEALCGSRYERGPRAGAGCAGDRTAREIGTHGGKTKIAPAGARKGRGAEIELPNWPAIRAAQELGPDAARWRDLHAGRRVSRGANSARVLPCCFRGPAVTRYFNPLLCD